MTFRDVIRVFGRNPILIDRGAFKATVEFRPKNRYTTPCTGFDYVLLID